jgi:plastocyanin
MQPPEITTVPFVSGPDEPLHLSQSPTQRNKKLYLIVAAGAILAIALVVTIVVLVSHSGHKTDNPVAINAKVANVSVGSVGLTPKSITIKKGQEITWTNTDPSPHHLTADQSMLPSFDTAEPLQQGDSYTYIFDKSGTFRYYDAADPTHFTGTITVQ